MLQALMSMMRSVLARWLPAGPAAAVGERVEPLRELDAHELGLVAGGAEPGSPYRGW